MLFFRQLRSALPRLVASSRRCIRRSWCAPPNSATHSSRFPTFSLLYQELCVCLLLDPASIKNAELKSRHNLPVRFFMINFWGVLRIRIRIIYLGKLESDQCEVWSWIRIRIKGKNRIRIRIEVKRRKPSSVILDHWRVQIWEKVSGRIRIRIRIQLKGRIRIRIEVKGRI